MTRKLAQLIPHQTHLRPEKIEDGTQSFGSRKTVNISNLAVSSLWSLATDF